LSWVSKRKPQPVLSSGEVINTPIGDNPGPEHFWHFQNPAIFVWLYIEYPLVMMLRIPFGTYTQ